jgi:hypothetical protein
METFAARVIEVLKRECSCSENLTTLMGQPIINLSDHSAVALQALKTEVNNLINRYLPLRDENIVITVRREGLEDVSFKVFISS